MPPDYWTHLNNPSFFEVMDFILIFYFHMFVFMVLNILFTIGFVWGLLILCRLLGIPWVDGTTKGFKNRS